MLLAVRACPSPEQPAYLGSDLHITQGSEVSRWDWDPTAKKLQMELVRPGQANGQIEVALPSPIQSVDLNGRSANWEPGAVTGSYRVELAFLDKAVLKFQC